MFPDVIEVQEGGRLVLNYHSEHGIHVTRGDVVHSFSVPGLGWKVDGVPGRLNFFEFSPKILGIYYGQCSEICGVNHSFIPIAIEVKL